MAASVLAGGALWMPLPLPWHPAPAVAPTAQENLIEAMLSSLRPDATQPPDATQLEKIHASAC